MPYHVREAVAALRATIADLRRAGVSDREIALAFLLALEAEPLKKAIEDRPDIKKGLGDFAAALKKISEIAKGLDGL